MSLDLVRQNMASNEFYADSILPDGKIHRFRKEQTDKNPDCWYVAFQWNTRSGEVGYNVVYADWHNNEVFKFCTINPTGDDKIYVEKTIREAQKKADKEQESEYEACREYCKNYLPTLESKCTAYLGTKGIKKPYGALSDGDNLIVPVINTKDEVQGYQIIEPNGKKRFKLHTAKKGNFFRIHGSEAVWLVEGFATGVTVHEATGDTVIVCFDAGNIPEVRKHFPSAILAGDNDEAGHKAGAGIFPPEDGLDWNDYAQAHGIQAVTDLLRQEPDRWVRCLGYRDDTYYYTSSSNRQIVSITASGHTANNFFTLQPKEYWEVEFPGKQGADWTQATSALLERCRLEGIFNPKNIRGTGVWNDQGPVINLGQTVYPKTPKSKYTYTISMPVSAPTKAEHPDLLLDILSRINFKQSNQAKLLAGWLTAAPFSGALPWRPHIWLTGSAGTGKSTVMEEIISPILGDYKLYLKGNTTEAGIRQMLDHNALPVIFDEFEQMGGNDYRTDGILDLCRQASSESSGEIMKGSSSGKSIQYNPRFCALVSSIRINLSNDADHSRFTVLDLDEPNREGYPDLIKLMEQITPEYSRGLFTTTYENFEKFLALIEFHRQDLSKKFSARYAQQHSVLLAGYEMITGDVIILDQEIYSSDHDICFDHLMSSLIKVELGTTKDRAVQECVNYMLKNPSQSDTVYYEEALERYGLRIKDDFLYVSANNTQLIKLFHNTKWVKGWAKSLSRISGAIFPAYVRINGKTTRAVKLPIKEFE
jgi:putative DNA primase/helicase